MAKDKSEDSSEATSSEESGQLVRDSKGRFVKGSSGNPVGRPKGSKNNITLLKLALEEAARSSLMDDMLEVVYKVVKAAKGGDSKSQKLVWDSVMSKQNISEDKSTGSKQQITVHTMNVSKKSGDILDGDYSEGEFTSESNEEEDKCLN